MDLHLTKAQATAGERAAVDSELGSPESSWEGGERKVAIDGRTSSTERKRYLLLPALHAVQKSIGWISPGAVNYVALRLNVAPAEVHGVASFYGMFSLEPRPPVIAHVCDDIACMTQGAEKLCSDLEQSLGPAGSACAGGKATWLRSQCLGLCERAPAALVTAAGKNAKERALAPATAQSVESLIKDAVGDRLPVAPDELDSQRSVPQAALQP